MRSIVTFLKDPRELAQAIVRKMFACRISDDKLYLSLLYRAAFGSKMHWDNPKTFYEKMTWLKVYDRNPEYG